ncbi:hypothetical protein RJ640_015741 [Escallonia rubra]|uniref:Glycoside hydrolase 35 catalytic domain-containing protein n=1 Tax=Escallonia rubra TaxID=112253 RepID=A0AA88RPL3_9ASTE|nr:hypothetical protein RJ640_015741 [Escallonia rubra]
MKLHEQMTKSANESTDGSTDEQSLEHSEEHPNDSWNLVRYREQHSKKPTQIFLSFGYVVPYLPVEDLAFFVARFFEKALLRTIMYFGGTNFGRTTRGPLIATSYDLDIEWILPDNAKSVKTNKVVKADVVLDARHVVTLGRDVDESLIGPFKLMMGVSVPEAYHMMGYLVTNDMKVDFNVLNLRMKYGIYGKVGGAQAMTPEVGRVEKRNAKFTKEGLESKKFSCIVGSKNIFRSSRRAGDNEFSLARPEDKVVT